MWLMILRWNESRKQIQIRSDQIRLKIRNFHWGKTNLENKGLISVDRDTKATLTRTIPCSIFKSYTKDLTFPIFELNLQPRLFLFISWKKKVPLQSYDFGFRKLNLFLLLRNIIGKALKDGNCHFPAWILA